MTERKWTPGPWVADVVECGAFQVMVPGKVICTRANWSSNAPASVANAHLIAAAPDLYEALEMAQLWLDVDGRFDMQRINAALAKARGE